MNIEKAYLSNEKDIIKFQYGEKIIRFRGQNLLGYALMLVRDKV